MGSTGDSYDNAMAESIIGLYKTEVIHAQGPWRSLDAVEYATLEWVDWFNNRRLLEPIGHVPPVEFEQESRLSGRRCRRFRSSQSMGRRILLPMKRIFDESWTLLTLDTQVVRNLPFSQGRSTA